MSTDNISHLMNEQQYPLASKSYYNVTVVILEM